MKPPSNTYFRIIAALLLVGAVTFFVHIGTQAETDTSSQTAAAITGTTTNTDSLLLDAYSSYAAFSLHKMRSDYNGSAVQIRRGSDGATQDFGFTADGGLDTEAIESWLSGADGYVVRWYNQKEGGPDLVQTNKGRQPFIAKAGSVTADNDARVAIKFDQSRNTYLTLESSLSASVPVHESLIYGVGDNYTANENKEGIINLSAPGNWSHYGFSFRGTDWGGFTQRGLAGQTWPNLDNPAFWGFNYYNKQRGVYSNNTRVTTDSFSDTPNRSDLTIGVLTKGKEDGYEGYLTEVAVIASQGSKSGVQDVYDLVNSDWDLGPENYNRQAILPQKYPYQVELYDWMETLSVSDMQLPQASFDTSNLPSDSDTVADIWLMLEGATASSVVRGEPGWYVLDAGNGKGIEATGQVRVWHEPKGSRGYGGNPPRSWSNEPAFLYQLDIPLADGSQGNPYYQESALCNRALSVAATDMMMYHKAKDDGGFAEWGDMYGKAMLGWAETYRWCKGEVNSSVQQAFEDGFSHFLDEMINGGSSPRAVNTNMDMFAIQAVAEIYKASDQQTIKDKTVQAAKKWLLGYTDGELGQKHKVFPLGDNDGGVYDPSGFIMEGGQPDIFYGGESIYHIAGAMSALADRDTGAIPSEWSFLKDIAEQLQEWRTYQIFYDPFIDSPCCGGNKAGPLYTAGAGISGRTSYGAPSGQSSEDWKSLTLADYFAEARFKEGPPSVSEMESDIEDKASYLTGELSSTYSGTPPTWSGWSPWTKKTPYLPKEGWYSRMQNRDGDPAREIPAARSNTSYNKAFGGHPVGDEYWSYKDSNGGTDFGWFVEAQAQQGSYGGWYGGKIETFWTEDTGVLLLNRHGKTGCDRTGVDDYSGNEDSTCWFNLDRKAGHHVWGRDENGNGFTTLLLRGRDLSRTSNFNLDGSPPTVSVVNEFNDPSLNSDSSQTGEQTGTELEGDVSVTNTFQARNDGIEVTHEVDGNNTDEVTELWASLPVYLRHYNPHRAGDNQQVNLEDTTIEYWDGSSWKLLPEDNDSDGTPELVTTDKLRLGRDFNQPAGTQYGYVALNTPHQIRLSEGKYYDPYQSKTGVRTVHIDLHGDPGTTKTLPASKSVSYTIQTTDPTTEQSDNNPPTADAGSNQTVTDSDEDGSESVSLDGSGSSDPDGNITSYSWSENGLEIATGVNPSVSFAVGTHTATLEVTDDDGATDTDITTVTVNEPANNPPTADAGSDQTVTDADENGSESVTLDGSNSADGDGSIDSYSWSQNDSEIATGQNPSVSLSVGTHTITLEVTDDDGATDTDTTTITVNEPANNPPTATDDTATTDEDTQTNIDVLAGDSDPDGDTLSVSDVLPATNGSVSINNDDTISYTPDSNYSGSDAFSYTISDGNGGTDSATVSITVNEVNDQPTADAGSDQTTTDSDEDGSETISLDGSGSSDPDNDISSYSWTEGGSEIATGKTSDVDLPVGTHTITLEVTDNDGASDSDTVTITINEPQVNDSDGDGVVDNTDVCPNTPPQLSVNSVGCPIPQTSKFDIKPDFSNVDMSNVADMKVGKNGVGQVHYKNQTLNLMDGNNPVNLNDVIDIGSNSITVNADTFSELDKPAELTFQKVTMTDPTVLRDGEECVNCEIVSHSGSTVTVSVPGFSTYTLAADTSDDGGGGSRTSGGGGGSIDNDDDGGSDGDDGGSGGGGDTDTEVSDDTTDDTDTTQTEEAEELESFIAGRTLDEVLREARRQLLQLLADIQAASVADPQLQIIRSDCDFTRDLSTGSSGSDVTCLQQYLQQEGFFPPDQETTGYFGDLTKRGVRFWQLSNDIQPAAGYFGSISRQAYQEKEG